jgi:hypothetical protein
MSNCILSMASAIDRNGPVLWPARSLDLNHCDFFLWGHLRQIVYETPVNTVEELTVRVNNAAESVGRNSDMLVRTQASMTQRAQVCIDNGGRHFEFSNIEFEG